MQKIRKYYLLLATLSNHPTSIFYCVQIVKIVKNTIVLDRYKNHTVIFVPLRIG